jgi:hypothetical protein
MSDSDVVRWSKSQVIEAKRETLTFMFTLVVSEWLGGGVLEEHPKCKTYVVTLVVVVYQDFNIEGVVGRSMIWAETCTRGSKFLRVEDDPETILTEELWKSEIEGYIKYFFTEGVEKQNLSLEPRADPTKQVVQPINVLTHRQTKVDPKLH